MDFGKNYLTTLGFYFQESRGLGKFIEEFIARKIDQFDEEYPIEDDLEKPNPDFYYFLVDDVSERWWQFSKNYPAEFRASYVSQLYSGIDTHLAKICMIHFTIHGVPKPWNRIDKGSEWLKKYKYLETNASVDFKELQEDWELLDQIRLIRNQIVHHHSTIAAADKDWDVIKCFILKHPEMILFKDDIYELDEGEHIPLYKARPKYKFKFQIVSPLFAEMVINTSESFFNKLIPQISFRKPA